MKKCTKLLLTIVLLLFSLAACGSEFNATNQTSSNEPKCSVTIEIECVENWFFSKYDVDMYIDDLFEGTIPHGETRIFTVLLTKGSHVLKFVSDKNDDLDGKIKINTQTDEKLVYRISCSSSGIDVETIAADSSAESANAGETTAVNASKITVTMNEYEFMGMLYTDAEAKLREMGFSIFEYKTIETNDIDLPDDTIGAVEIKSWMFSDGNFVAGDTFDTDAVVVLWYYICDEPVPNLTVENCPDLVALLALKDPSDPSVATFANKYSGQVIEFDGCVVAMQKHGEYKTRWDVMLGAGNYDANRMRGPNFRLTDVNYYDMNVTGGDSVHVGLNVHVVAKVGRYNANTSLFELEIISMKIQ